MLYWTEGARTGTVVDCTNSNPTMIRLFLAFLRNICGVSESRLRVYLYCHGDAATMEAAKRFWQRVTHIPLAQFARPYVRTSTMRRQGRIMPHGLIHIRYSDKKLLELIQRWIAEYVVVCTGQVPKRPTGAVCKTAG